MGIRDTTAKPTDLHFTLNIEVHEIKSCPQHPAPCTRTKPQRTAMTEIPFQVPQLSVLIILKHEMVKCYITKTGFVYFEIKSICVIFVGIRRIVFDVS